MFEGGEMEMLLLIDSLSEEVSRRVTIEEKGRTL